jgi:hypothetical protein
VYRWNPRRRAVDTRRVEVIRTRPSENGIETVVPVAGIESLERVRRIEQVEVRRIEQVEARRLE